ncbi:alcohol dehydrogenase [Paenibacillus naphthalenovorans]|uniref:alcohol dehydrogenase catalytic domain-containing protein n=1 Tax=Paenibacillus naphthalenovorans TaxID=162209 RepID=UPI0010B8BEEF|nr:alcohol dehydrogenase catalytic domain-containing protein [Paenibacillus naphthalenovorans]GCL74080.1 alcohol dehydrogenase [Paenibacillus naphthalenovorans]
MMKCVIMKDIGGADCLEVREAPMPEPKPDEALIKVHAAGICYHDLLDRSGKLHGPKAGNILGHEVSGEVVELGKQAKGLQIGQQVVLFHRMFCGHCRYCLGGRQDLCKMGGILGSNRPGGYAEYVCVPSWNAIPLPQGLSPEAAALAVCPIGTSIRAVISVADVRPGDTVLVTGASGGLGLHQIQVAKSRGANVIAITSSSAKENIIRSVGADEVIVSPDLKFSGDVWSLTAKQGVQAVLENVVSATFGESLRCLAPNGIAVVLGNTEMRKIEIDPGLIIGRRLRIEGSGNPTLQDVRRSLHLLDTGQVRPIIDRIVPFTSAAEAHAILEQRSVSGRIVMKGW